MHQRPPFVSQAGGTLPLDDPVVTIATFDPALEASLARGALEPIAIRRSCRAKRKEPSR
jgi:hypothetical protein